MDGMVISLVKNVVECKLNCGLAILAKQMHRNSDCAAIYIFYLELPIIIVQYSL
jgi:hypothetical protein